MSCPKHPNEGETVNGTCKGCRHEELKFLNHHRQQQRLAAKTVWDDKPGSANPGFRSFGSVPESPDRYQAEKKRVRYGEESR